MTVDPDEDRRTFWSARRRRYNVALVASGIGAGLAFLAVLLAWEVWPPPPGEGARADFEMLSILGGPIAFAIAVGLANVCYSAGPAVELLLRPRNPQAFRQRAFTIGCGLLGRAPVDRPAERVVRVHRDQAAWVRGPDSQSGLAPRGF